MGSVIGCGEGFYVANESSEWSLRLHIPTPTEEDSESSEEDSEPGEESPEPSDEIPPPAEISSAPSPLTLARNTSVNYEL